MGAIAGRASRIAIAQMQMHWSSEDNTAAIERCLADAARAGARICVFPELALTGYHRRIGNEAVPERVTALMARVQRACAGLSIAASVGAPRFDTQGRIYNSQLFVDAHGRLLGAVDKQGLTEPEAGFFAPGRDRPVLELQGWRCSAVLCREIENLQPVREQFAASPPELLIWPGLMRPDPNLPLRQPPAHVEAAQRMARELAVYLIQANWPNSLNYPEESAESGRSVVINPRGDIELALPAARPGLAVFAPGEGLLDWQEHDTSI